MSIKITKQLTFDSHFIQDIIDSEDRLVKLSKEIDWDGVMDGLRPYYSSKGRRSLPMRMMVGLHLLKHMNKMSDTDVADRLKGDIYWMEFCGVDPLMIKKSKRHLNSSSMTKFRNRIGREGFCKIEEVIRRHLIKEKALEVREMTLDSTCMEKHIEYPTDSGLLDKGRRNMIKIIKRLEEMGIRRVKGLRSYARRSKQIVVTIMKLGKDRAERIKAGTLELSRQAAHVIRKSNQVMEKARYKMKRLDRLSFLRAGGLIERLKNEGKILKKVVRQARERFQGRHMRKKIYSLHEPQVINIRKGKRGKPNEYGSLVNLCFDKKGYVVSHQTYHENKHDSKLLKPALKRWEEVTERLPKQVNGDRGYSQKLCNIKGCLKQVSKLCIPRKGKQKHPEHNKFWFKRGQKDRSKAEAYISHLKFDHGLDRCRYHGVEGDHINVSLASMAWNLTKYAKAI